MLHIENLEVRYGRLAAVRGVSLAVNQGEIVCVIGPNGAGKSSLFGAIAGGIAPYRGSVRFDSKEIAGARPERIARLGLSDSRGASRFQHAHGGREFADRRLHCAWGGLHRRTPVANHGSFSTLAERRGLSAGGLSGGEQQMLVIGRALMTNPRLMLIDEPSLGLAPKIVDQVYEILLELRRKDGLTLLINEQSSKRVLKHADRVYVLRNGEVKLQDHARNLQDGEAIMQAYFGFDAANTTSGAPA